MELLEQIGIDGITLIRLLCSLFIAILFIQSGLDKVLNYQGEKSFYKQHFSKSFLKDTVHLLMPTITLFELAAGFLSGIGIILLVINGNIQVAFWGMLLAAISICMLFFGQRVAKDYAGAAVLVSYFLLTLVGLYAYLI